MFQAVDSCKVFHLDEPFQLNQNHLPVTRSTSGISFHSQPSFQVFNRLMFVDLTQTTVEDSMTRISKTFVAIAVLALLLAVSSRSTFAATHYYVVANNDTSPTNSDSVFQVSGSSLVSLTTVPTGGSAMAAVILPR